MLGLSAAMRVTYHSITSALREAFLFLVAYTAFPVQTTNQQQVMHTVCTLQLLQHFSIKVGTIMENN